MDQAFEMIGAGLIVPAVLATISTHLAHALLPPAVSRRCSLAIALALGYVAGYACLPEWAEWLPTRHWHWLPPITIAAALVGPISFAQGVSLGERLSLSLLLAFVVACLIVPQWENLQPVRGRYIALLTIYLFVIAGGSAPLADRMKSRAWLGILLMVAAALAVAIFAVVSIRFGQLTGMLVAATFGMALGASWPRRDLSLRGVSFGFFVLAGSLAFISGLDPDPAVWELLGLPAAPLILWATAYLPGRQTELRAALIDFAAVAFGVILITGWIVMRR